MIRLTVTEGDTSREIALAEDMISIGRSAENLIHLKDDKTSRRHVAIIRTGGAYRIANLESKNGILLNGAKTDAGPLAVGDEIRLGDTRIRVTSIDVPESPDQPTVQTARAVASRPGRGHGLLAVACVAGAALAVLIWAAVPPSPAPPPPDRPDDGLSALERLRTRAEQAPRITPEMVREAIELGRKHNGPYLKATGSSGTPFDRLLNRLLQRRAEEFARRFAAARAKVDAALDAGRYGDALTLATTFGAGEDEMFQATAGAMDDRVLERIDEAHLATAAVGEKLERAGNLNEASTHYVKAASRFKGTEHHGAFSEKRALIAARIEAAKKEKEEKEKKPDPPAVTGAEAAAREKADRVSRETAARAPALCRRVAEAGDREKLQEAFEELLALHRSPDLTKEAAGSVREQAIAALRECRERRVRSLEVQERNAADLRRILELKEELDRRRAAAIEAIYDKATYLPEDHPDWKMDDALNGQSGVDKRVQAVRGIWSGGDQLSTALHPSIRTDLAMVRAIDEDHLTSLAAKPETVTPGRFLRIRINLLEKLDLRNVALDRKERERHAWDRRVEAFNRKLEDPRIDDEAKAHVRVVNDYREMMGRKRLFIDPRLCAASSKHSVVQNDAQRIWHVGSDGDPRTRARAAGFPAGVAENVAIGYPSPDEIWTRGWYRASDHHRNGLSDAWTCMGYGFEGNVGTQLFSNIPPPKAF